MSVAAVGPVVAVRGLVKDYGAVHAIRGIDFDVSRGEILGFLGPNGAGKSTTIRCLLDLLRPTAGRIEVFGLDPRHHGVEIRGRLAYVPGELRLPERMSARQLVDSIARIRGPYAAGRRDELAERLKLGLGRQTRDLSSGNRRKLALLLAFLWPTELLVLDEPTNGLDPLMQHEFLTLARDARNAGATVFLSSHVLSEVQRIADRVVVLRAGRVVAEGSVHELRNRARQRVEIWLDGEIGPDAVAALPSLESVAIEDHCVVGILCGPVGPLLRALGELPVAHALIEEPDLEETFLDLYEDAP